MQIVSQLSIFLENKPGVFARVCSEFAKEDINLMAIMVEDAVDHAVVRLVADDNKKACEILELHGAVAIENDILAVDMPNKPGELVKLADKLAGADINIDYAYGSSSGDNKGTTTIYVRVKDPEAALGVLRV